MRWLDYILEKVIEAISNFISKFVLERLSY